MKFLATLAIILVTLQLSLANDVAQPEKQCKDFISESTCKSLQQLVKTLKESSTTVQEAINAGVLAHIQTSKEMLEFVKNFIAERVQCQKVLTQDMCTVLTGLAKQLKLTQKQLGLAIEMAVNGTKETTQQIYKKVLDIIEQGIDCNLILGQKACDNMGSALDKLKEQHVLIKEAIMSVALKHYQNTKLVLGMVQEELVKQIKNFSCKTVIPEMICMQLSSIAKQLKISADKVREAIELALMNGITKANDIKNFVVDFLVEQIKCINILTPVACSNLLEATKKLHEQKDLIKQAIMAAVLDKITDVNDIYDSVKTKLMEKATNFTCTDILTEKQCNLLNTIRERFHIRKEELKSILAKAVVQGISSASEIYKVTVVAFMEEAQNLKCEDMIDPQVCSVLDAFAANLGETVDDVTEAVREAIGQGLTTAQDIRNFVKNLLIDEKSCIDFFKSKMVCGTLQFAAYVKGITFDAVMNKIKSLYASGVTSVRALLQGVKSFFGFGDSRKRRAIDIGKNKDELVDIAMQILSGIATITEKMKTAIKHEIQQLISAGKMNVFNMYTKVKELIQKYNPISNDYEGEVSPLYEMKGVSDIYKAGRIALKNAIEKLMEAAKRAGMKTDELMKMINDIYNKGAQDLDDIILSSF